MTEVNHSHLQVFGYPLKSDDNFEYLAEVKVENLGEIYFTMYYRDKKNLKDPYWKWSFDFGAKDFSNDAIFLDRGDSSFESLEKAVGDANDALLALVRKIFGRFMYEQKEEKEKSSAILGNPAVS